MHLPYPTSTIGGLIAFLAIFAAALLWFGFSMWYRLRLLAAMGPEEEPRFDNIPRRIWETIKIAIGQTRMIRGEYVAGAMHAFIFWGFLAVALNTVHMVGGGFVRHGFAFPFLGPGELLGNLYLPVRDVFELVVLVAVSFAIYRRVIVKPERLTLSGEAILILVIIGTLMVTDFLATGCETGQALAAGETPAGFAWSPAARLLGPAFQGAGEPVRLYVLHISWWVHLVALLYFLNLLPLGKHFHVITSIPNVFLNSHHNYGALRKYDVEKLMEEGVESFGINEVEQFGWKVGSDVYSCTECGRCSAGCPCFSTEKPLSPKQVNIDIRHHLMEKGDHILEKAAKLKHGEEPPVWEGTPLIGEKSGISLDVIWDCTSCKYCEDACPIGIEKVQWIVDMRRYLVMTESNMEKEVQNAFRGLEQHSNPWGIGSNYRQDWIEGLDVPLCSDGAEFDYLFYVGCSGSFDDRNKKVATATVKLLKAAGIKFAILGNEEGCCGDSARRMGNEYLFSMLAQANIEVFKAYGVKKIITACPHGYNTLKNEYSQWGDLELEVHHHSEFLLDLVRQGKLEPTHPVDASLVYHDSCYLGRYNKIYDAPRELLDRIPGVKRSEVASDRNRAKGMCCGAGGGRMWMEENRGQRINRLRVEQLTATGATTCATACPFCLVMIGDGLKETDRDEGYEAVDIAELLLTACGLGKKQQAEPEEAAAPAGEVEASPGAEVPG